jgi:hypothetical protein
MDFLVHRYFEALVLAQFPMPSSVFQRSRNLYALQLSLVQGTKNWQAGMQG